MHPRRDYRVDLARDGGLVTERGSPLDVPKGWTPEHLLLAALARCALHALRYHAGRASVSVEGGASAAGAIDRREDGSWGFVEVTCSLDVTLEPEPPPPELAGILDRTEHGCFIGASLDPKPTYHWRVNGADLR